MAKLKGVNLIKQTNLLLYYNFLDNLQIGSNINTD